MSHKQHVECETCEDTGVIDGEPCPNCVKGEGKGEGQGHGNAGGGVQTDSGPIPPPDGDVGH